MVEENTIINVKLQIAQLAKRINDRCYKIAFGKRRNDDLFVVIDTGKLSKIQIDELDEFMEELSVRYYDFCVPIEEYSGLRVGKRISYKVRLTKVLICNGLIDSKQYYCDSLKFNINFQVRYLEEVGDEQIILDESKFIKSKSRLRTLSEFQCELYNDDDVAGFERESICHSLLNLSGRKERPGMSYDYRSGNWVNNTETETDDY